MTPIIYGNSFVTYCILHVLHHLNYFLYSNTPTGGYLKQYHMNTSHFKKQKVNVLKFAAKTKTSSCPGNNVRNFYSAMKKIVIRYYVSLIHYLNQVLYMSLFDYKEASNIDGIGKQLTIKLTTATLRISQCNEELTDMKL